MKKLITILSVVVIVVGIGLFAIPEQSQAYFDASFSFGRGNYSGYYDNGYYDNGYYDNYYNNSYYGNSYTSNPYYGNANYYYGPRQSISGYYR